MRIAGGPLRETIAHAHDRLNTFFTFWPEHNLIHSQRRLVVDIAD
jgi:hypothetical protein